jgi:hypothetical protein
MQCTNNTKDGDGSLACQENTTHLATVHLQSIAVRAMVSDTRESQQPEPYNPTTEGRSA